MAAQHCTPEHPWGGGSGIEVALPHDSWWSGSSSGGPTHTTARRHGGSTQPLGVLRLTPTPPAAGAACKSLGPQDPASDSDTHELSTPGSSATSTPRQLGNSNKGTQNKSLRAHRDPVEEHETQAIRTKVTKAIPKSEKEITTTNALGVDQFIKHQEEQ